MPSPGGCRTSAGAMPNCGGIFDFEAKQQRLAEVVKLAEDPAVWSDPKRAQELGREKKTLESLVDTMTKLDRDLVDSTELFERLFLAAELLRALGVAPDGRVFG